MAGSKRELSLPSRPEPITLWSFYLPKNAELWRNSIEYLHDSGYWFSKYYGDYPYNHITAVDGDLSAGGGGISKYHCYCNYAQQTSFRNGYYA